MVATAAMADFMHIHTAMNNSGLMIFSTISNFFSGGLLLFPLDMIIPLTKTSIIFFDVILSGSISK